MPYGVAKSIVGTLRVGDTCLARPKAAHRLRRVAGSLGVAVIIRPVRRNGVLLHWFKRVPTACPLRTTRHFGEFVT